MQIQIDRRTNRIVLHCAGDLDEAGARDVSQAVQSLDHPVGVTPVVLDFSSVASITDRGLAALGQVLETHGVSDSEEKSTFVPVLRLANVPPHIQQELDESGLSELFAREPKADAGRFHADQQHLRELLSRVREAFPVPISDSLHDAYFVQSVARALDRVDQLKSGQPYLGASLATDFENARAAKPPEKMSSLEAVIADMADYLQGHVIWGHPHTQEQVIPPTTMASILGQMFGAIYNPNILWDAYSHRVAQAEVELTAMCASLVNYDPAKAGGVSTFSGTGTELYGVRIGLEKAQPGSFRDGLRRTAKIVSSDVSHYCRLNIAAWLGLGMESVVSVRSEEDNAMCLSSLEAALRYVLQRGELVACIIATVGTTDAFGLDNVEAIVQLRDRLAREYRLTYRPHVHADAVIGWPWTVFNDYEFSANPLGFSHRTVRSLWDARTVLRGLHCADSIGLDFHKTGYAPIASSLFLCRDQGDLELISRDRSLMPYLFQFGSHRPGLYTLETSRPGASVLAALANLKLFGKEGYRVLLGHIVSMAEVLRAKLERAPYARVVNDANHGMVTLFRVYPDGVAAEHAYREETTQPEKMDQLRRHNAYNQKVFEALHRQVERGDGMNIGMTDQYRCTTFGTPIAALKSFVMSPFVDESSMEYLMECLARAREEVGDDWESLKERNTES